jgi:hypothetical protein
MADSNSVRSLRHHEPSSWTWADMSSPCTLALAAISLQVERQETVPKSQDGSTPSRANRSG